MNLSKIGILFSALLVVVSCADKPKQESKTQSSPMYVTTPLGRKITITTPSEKMLKLYKDAKEEYIKDPFNVDHIIWLGRRTAYLGKYEEAIKVYTEGIDKFPNDPRLYRHRGHRYISVRKFDQAIKDLEYAAQLIKDTEDVIEPDGLPNAQNIPISTLHGNIWYHLGLVYYLKQDMEKAYQAYLNCRNLKSNDDNMVSSTHWLYMIQRRLGNQEKAEKLLTTIHDGMNIIENTSYYTLCKFYKGLVPMDSLQTQKGGSPQNDAIRYGIANWYFYNNEAEMAKEMIQAILDGSSWNSFGYIAAESDYITHFKESD